MSQCEGVGFENLYTRGEGGKITEETKRLNNVIDGIKDEIMTLPKKTLDEIPGKNINEKTIFIIDEMAANAVKKIEKNFLIT